MATRIITGAVGDHPLDGPGQFGGALVVGASLNAAASIRATNAAGVAIAGGNAAAASGVGTSLGMASVSIPQWGQVIVTLRNAADQIQVSFAGPYG